MAFRPKEDYQDFEPRAKTKMVSRRKNKVAHKKEHVRNPQKPVKPKKTYQECMTINTDASFDPKYGVGGWAFFIRFEDLIIQKGGPFKKDPLDSHDAEMMAVGNALAQLLKYKNLKQTKRLTINMDCMTAMNRIRNRETERGKAVHQLWIELIEKLQSTKNRFWHIKSHTKKSDRRSKDNEWCDREAKKHMREARRKRMMK